MESTRPYRATEEYQPPPAYAPPEAHGLEQGYPAPDGYKPVTQDYPKPQLTHPVRGHKLGQPVAVVSTPPCTATEIYRPPPAYVSLETHVLEQGYPAPNGYNPVPQDYPKPQPTPPVRGNTGGQPVTVVVDQRMEREKNGTVTVNRPNDYMTLSIFACVCCFWPTGLCAIYYSSRRNHFMAQGDISEATRMSSKARSVIVLSFILGITYLVVMVTLQFSGLLYFYKY